MNSRHRNVAALAEKAKAQGINDMVVYVVMATSSAASGAILYRFGWSVLNYAALPLLICTGAAILWLAVVRRAADTAPNVVAATLE